MKDKADIWSEIVNNLIVKKLTIATMESCTGGGIANEITNISGASSVLKESFITYCNESKIRHGVPENIIEQFTVYSKETAIEMAKTVKKITNSHIGIGVTGQLGRIDPNNPVGNLNCVWYAIITPNNKIEVRKIQVSDDERKMQKKFVIKHIAITLLDIINKY